MKIGEENKMPNYPPDVDEANLKTDVFLLKVWMAELESRIKYIEKLTKRLKIDEDGRLKVLESDV